MFTTINTHQFIKDFIKFSKNNSANTEKRAELIANTISKSQTTMLEKLSTKKDLESVKMDFESEFRLMRNEFKLVRQEINNSMLKTIVSLGAIMAVVEKLIN